VRGAFDRIRARNQHEHDNDPRTQPQSNLSQQPRSLDNREKYREIVEFRQSLHALTAKKALRHGPFLGN
jgi:hypothetical protein